MSAIAREFDCTPSAISYIVRKAEAAGVTPDAGEEEPAPAAVPQPSPPPEATAAEAPARPPRRAAVPREPEPPQDQPDQAVAPIAPEPVSVREAPPAPSASRDPLQHESGRLEAPRGEQRRFEGRESRPPREPRENRFGGENPQRPAGVPRFPQGGQRERFGGERRDRMEIRENRPPRENDRQERVERLPPEIGGQPAEVTYPYRQQQRNPARLEAQETPTVPADERMDTASKACAEAYRAWKEQSDGSVQALGDAIHELRKVIARMEIEVSASRKEEQRPIPIPTYRLKQPAPQQPRG